MEKVFFVDEEKWFVDPFINRVKAYGDFDSVDYFEDGFSVLEALETDSENVKYIVLDLQLPIDDEDMDRMFENSQEFPKNIAGLFILRQIRKKYPKIKILCMTILTDPEIRNFIANEGAEYLSKTTQNLVDRVLEFLRK